MSNKSVPTLVRKSTCWEYQNGNGRCIRIGVCGETEFDVSMQAHAIRFGDDVLVQTTIWYDTETIPGRTVVKGFDEECEGKSLREIMDHTQIMWIKHTV